MGTGPVMLRLPLTTMRSLEPLFTIGIEARSKWSEEPPLIVNVLLTTMVPGANKPPGWILEPLFAVTEFTNNPEPALVEPFLKVTLPMTVPAPLSV